MKTVQLVNPWSKAVIEKPVSEIIPNLQSIPWPEECEQLPLCDTDEEWIVQAVELMGPDRAGIVIIGS